MQKTENINKFNEQNKREMVENRGGVDCGVRKIIVERGGRGKINTNH